MKFEYVPKTDEQVLAYFVEEVGEALAAVGKAQRWGLSSSNPELPPEERETNAEWIMRELIDVERAVRFMRTLLTAHRVGRPVEEAALARVL